MEKLLKVHNVHRLLEKVVQIVQIVHFLRGYLDKKNNYQNLEELLGKENKAVLHH